MTTTPTYSGTLGAQRRQSWLMLLALWLLLLGMSTLRPLAVPDEGRYGEISRWMLVSGDWLTPRLNGLPFFHKPPLLHWLQAISLGVFGVHEFALRLVPALHAGVMVSALYLGARTVCNEVLARRAAIMLGTSLTFLIGGQYVNHDMLVATWIGVAIWLFALAFLSGDKPHPALARWGFVACALGMLSKGLIGIALPGLVLLVWLVWTRQVKKILLLPWVSGLALFGVIALPWFVMAQRAYPDFFNYMFVGQQFNRYTAGSYNNPQAWWFYLAAITLLMFPWVFFALGQVRRVTAMTVTSAVGSSADGWRLCWVWVVAVLVFFSIPSSKLVGYILPIMAPLALLGALGWQRVMSHRAWSGKAFAALCAMNVGIALALVLNVGAVTKPSRTEDVAAVLACAATPTDRVYVRGAFPYDLPFYAQTSQAMIVLDDWAWQRQHARDGWQRELFEGADFDAAAAQQVLQSSAALADLGQAPGNWLLVRSKTGNDLAEMGWSVAFHGAGWDLFRSDGPAIHASAPKRPESAQYIGLPGCDH